MTTPTTVRTPSRRRRIAAAVVALTATTLGLATSARSAVAADVATTPAIYEDGTIIDLADGWGPAKACRVDPEVIHCFSSEAKLDEYVASTFAASATKARRVVRTSGVIVPLATCATTLKLYDGTSYTGSMLSFGTRGSWINLSGYSFDNKTSSYVVGACAAEFAENAGGGGAWYPGNTSAGASSSTMSAGWDNRVSSVIIY